MSAPYWGNLDPPAVNRTNSTKRNDSVRTTDDPDLPSSHRASQYQPRQAAARQQRASIQSQAPTDSTISPFASPTASSFHPEGLAPRPSSFQRGANGADNELAERRRRRASRDPESYYTGDESLPAAPEAPSARAGPPISYKMNPDRRPVIAVDTTQGGDVRRSASTRTTQNKGSNPQRSNTDSRRERAPKSASAEYSRDQLDSGVARQGSVDSRKERPTVVEPGRSNSRRVSNGDPEGQRRREWAPDRSPLQRLELTLDSITKEEKRARVQEAEALARERAAAAEESGTSEKKSVAFRNRPVGKGSGVSEAEVARKPSSRPREVLTASAEQPQRTTPSSSRQTKIPVPQSEKDLPLTPRQAEKLAVPSRQSSARERVAPVAAAAAVGATAGAALGRTGSNRLRKEPPGDPWYNRRREAEEKYKEITPRQSQEVENQRNADRSAAVPPAVAKQDKITKSRPEQQTQQALKKETEDYDDKSSDELDTPPVRRGPSRKIAQLTGQPVDQSASKSQVLPVQQQLYADRLDRSEELGPANGRQQNTQGQIRTVNGVNYSVPPGAEDGNYGQEQAAKGLDGHHHFSNIIHPGKRRSQYVPGDGIYAPTKYMDEWKKGGIALLSGALLDLETQPVKQTEAEKDKAWWEAGHSGKRRASTAASRKAEAYDGVDEDPNAPTTFKPKLFLKCGPLLRYCGMRRDAAPVRPGSTHAPLVRDIWRGSVMIVTSDSDSVYETAPTLRLFVQSLDLLPPPPAHVDGGLDDLAPEYVDPIAGLPKIGRDGRTLYVRPVEELEEEKDLSKDESENGLFERTRSMPGQYDGPAVKNPTGPRQKFGKSGESMGKHAEVKGFRLHCENGLTFWRFNIEVELGAQQQRIAYRINRGPTTGFWVPGRDDPMNIMFHSCNGFSLSVNPDQLSGPDPLWRDVLNNHQTQPFHVMIGGGDQIYMDSVMKDTGVFQEWLGIKNPLHKHNAPFTSSMQDELEKYYLERYAMWFSQGLFGLANSQIPMVNIYDDHDIIDGFGSYPDHFMDSPVFSGLGAVAFKYYMLFQHQSVVDELEDDESSWILGNNPGPYIKEKSRSVFMSMGKGIQFLGLDCRTERTRDQILSHDTLDKIFDRCHEDIVKGDVKHLIILLGVPIAYPRLVWLENILTSRLMDPVKALSKAGMFGNLLNQFDGGVEILDDLDDHWTAKNHKKERLHLIEDFQDLAAEKSVRITILGGDVHLAAMGQFYSNPKLGIPKDKDHRYMPNIISSAIVNNPPPEMMADVLNKRNKVHHLDGETDEDMIPIFVQDVNGKPRNNKHLLPRRNWCSIRQYNPELTPPHTPVEERSPSPPRRRGLLRRFSSSQRGPSYRAENAGPPLSRGSLMRNLSLVGRRPSTDSDLHGEKPPQKRSLSLNRDFTPGSLFRRFSNRKADNGGINGYGSETEDDLTPEEYQNQGPRLRGGASSPDGYFPPQDDYDARPVRTRSRVTRSGVQKELPVQDLPVQRGRAGGGAQKAVMAQAVPIQQEEDHRESPRQAPAKQAIRHDQQQQSQRTKIAQERSQQSRQSPEQPQFQPPVRSASFDVTPGGEVLSLAPVRRPFHRTPTNLSEKKKRTGGGAHDVNLEFGLDICLNVEVSQKDPAGITVPYRLLVPALWYEEGEDGPITHVQRKPSGFKRLMSFGAKERPKIKPDFVEGVDGRDYPVDNRLEMSGGDGTNDDERPSGRGGAYVPGPPHVPAKVSVSTRAPINEPIPQSAHEPRNNNRARSHSRSGSNSISDSDEYDHQPKKPSGLKRFLSLGSRRQGSAKNERDIDQRHDEMHSQQKESTDPNADPEYFINQYGEREAVKSAGKGSLFGWGTSPRAKPAADAKAGTLPTRAASVSGPPPKQVPSGKAGKFFGVDPVPGGSTGKLTKVNTRPQNQRAPDSYSTNSEEYDARVGASDTTRGRGGGRGGRGGGRGGVRHGPNGSHSGSGSSLSGTSSDSHEDERAGGGRGGLNRGPSVGGRFGRMIGIK